MSNEKIFFFLADSGMVTIFKVSFKSKLLFWKGIYLNFGNEPETFKNAVGSN